ncbi:MAG: cytoplasmic protein [Planctomycetes bacterium]|nr:cytoplasmic protein [Planctomycetota bacterium]
MAPVPDVDRAHPHSIRNRPEILASERCGCFYCLRTFAPAEVDGWLAVEHTALCPYCGIDSVLGSASGFPVTAEFLRRMHARWFDTKSG